MQSPTSGTPLHYAVNRGGIQGCKISLDHGAKVNALSNFDYTPLHYAANHGKIKSLELLISKGATLNIQNTFGHTPLHFARLIIRKHKQIVTIVRMVVILFVGSVWKN